MLKVLIVDDDKLARQGLILSIRWEDFGMKVVGEAPNGVKALQYLDENPVDLVLTDLAMPVMSGIELMKKARDKHRNVLFVVLTFHEDFATAQEALRLGAIDYISKLQLEKENLDTILGRIRDRIAGNQQRGPSGGGTSVAAWFAVDDQADPSNLAAALSDDGAELEEIGPGAFLWMTIPNELWHEWGSQPPRLGGWFLVRVDGILGESRTRIANLLRQYQAERLFYDHDSSRGHLVLGFDQLERERSTPPSEGQLNGLRTSLTAMDWMNDPDAFSQLMAQLRAQRLPYRSLIRLLASVESEWNRVYGPWSSQRLELPETFHVLQDVEGWLNSIRDFTLGRGALSGHSREVQTSVLRSLRILHTEFDRPLHSSEIAQRVNMSRSHFSLCFRQIVGKSFLDYLSEVRLEAAKDLLVRFDWAIYEVSARSGYTDERYFSRLFKAATGLLPSEYRKKHA